MAVFREKTDLHYNHQIDLINKNSGIVVIKKITKEVFKMAQPAYLKYRLLNLPSTNVVQKVYVGATYVYALQLINSNTNVVISRIPKTNVTSTYDLDFSSGEQTYLNNFGHGQTWEYFSHNGEDYWWGTSHKGMKGGLMWVFPFSMTNVFSGTYKPSYIYKLTTK